MAKKSGRIFFLDELRGLALIGMIVYHTAYDLRYIFGLHFNFDSAGWNAFQLWICCTFIIIAGISCRLSKNSLKHGVVVLSAGMLMTLGTYFFMPDMIIWFGILHFLGISIILYYLLRKAVSKAPAALCSVFALAVFLPEVYFSERFVFRATFISQMCLPRWGFPLRIFIRRIIFRLFPGSFCSFLAALSASILKKEKFPTL